MKNFFYKTSAFFQKWLAKLFFLGAVVFVVFSISQAVFADVIAQQTDFSASESHTGFVAYKQQLGNNFSTGQIIGRASVKIASPSGTQLAHARITECDTTPCTDYAFYNWTDPSLNTCEITTASTNCDFNFTGTPLTAGKYYFLSVYSETSAGLKIYGSTSDNYTDGVCKNDSGIGEIDCSVLQDLYFILETPAETCFDGIQNQDETNIDVGGVCELVYLTAPADSTAVEDFSQWSVGWNGIDATSESFIISVHWADNYDIVSACEDFPSGTGAGYEACINGVIHINADYSPIFGGYELGLTGTSNINKNTPLVIGNTYYAQVIIQDGDEMGVPVVASGISSFTAGVATGGVVSPIYEQCEGLDIGCYLLNALKYLFYPSDIASSKLHSLIDTIKNKPPIGYISGVITALNAIDTNATPTLAFASFTPINEHIFTPLRTGLVWILWFLFLFMLLKRFMHFQL